MRRSRFLQERPEWWTAIVGIASFVHLLVLRDITIRDPDTYWHIATGQWILDHWAIPFRDPFSFSMPGAEWVPHQWLGEVILALVYNGGGWSAVATLVCFVFAVILALLTHQLLKSLMPIHALIFVILAWLMWFMHALARPYFLAAPFQLIWIATLVNSRQANRCPPFSILPLMVLWANLHADCIVGLVFTLLFAAEAVWASASWRAALNGPFRQWGLFALCALIAAMLTPNGITELLFPFHLIGMKFIVSNLTEWLSPNFQVYQPIEVWLIFALFVALCFGLKLPLSRLLILLLLVHLALTHVRNGELLATIGPLITAHALGPQLVAARQKRYLSYGESVPSYLDRVFEKLKKPIPARGMLAAIAIIAVATAWSWSMPITRGDDEISPISAMKSLTACQRNGRVFNWYNAGGYLIMNGVPTFIDGRADMYGDKFFENYLRAVKGEDNRLQKLLGEYDIAWTMLPPGIPAVAILDLLPGWQRVYADKYAVVHIQKSHMDGNCQ